MAIALVVIVLGILFVYGGITGSSITGLLLGKQEQRTPPAGSGTATYTDPAVNSQPGQGTTSGSITANTQQWQLLNIADKYLGVPYRWGGNDPATGIDCSRFVQLVYQALGINLPRTSQAQSQLGKTVSINDLQIGDVIFTEPTATGPNHEGIYVGNGLVQESPHTGLVNETIPLEVYLQDGLVTVKRYL